MILGIYGAGGLGNELYELAEDVNIVCNNWNDIIFIDDSYNNLDKFKKIMTFNKLSKFLNKNNLNSDDIEFVIGVGEPLVRKKLYNRIKENGYKLTSLVHPKSRLSKNSNIGAGVIVGFGSYISCNVTIKENTLIMPLTSIGHDTNIGSNSVISSYVSVGGNSVIGSQTFMGMGVQVIQNSNIGSNSIVSIGSVVTRDIDNDVIALGNPARAIRRNEKNRVFKGV
ncbi:NeuD/PglB/VioB family sugar acetyltransferase [Candidatus Izemoplasma sp. B36]|uniref:NeuD/PglB/VioB family sugar acetyltransferase n=1 Tax=Candidatus Izemoplasma sp. B36 TaxID=3242468 RepID=UPI003556F0F5